MPRPPKRSAFSYLLPLIAIIIVVAIVALVGRFYSDSSDSQVAEAKPAAELTILAGQNVKIKYANSITESDAADGITVYPGDTIRTGDDSEAELIYFDDSVTRLAAGTELTVNTLLNSDEKTIVDTTVTRGQVWNRVLKLLSPESEFSTETPNTIASVRGTAYEVNVDEAGDTDVTVANNEVEVQAYEFIEKTGVDGSTVRERQILASTTVGMGNKTAVKVDDIEALKNKTQILEIREMTEEDLASPFYMKNLDRDEAHLKAVKAKIAAQLAEQEKGGLFRKRDLAEEKRLKLLQFEIENQLRKLPTRSILPAEEGDSEEGDEDSSSPQIIQKVMSAPNGTYVVQSGDYLALIAKAFGVSVEDIAKWNDLQSPYNLQVGQKLSVPSGITPDFGEHLRAIKDSVDDLNRTTQQGLNELDDELENVGNNVNDLPGRITPTEPAASDQRGL